MGIPLYLASIGGDPIANTTSNMSPSLYKHHQLPPPLPTLSAVYFLFCITKGSSRMRSAALVLAALMMVSSCMAANRKTLMVETKEKGLVEDEKPSEETNDMNDHHNIPRQDYNNYGGSGPKGGGGGGSGSNKAINNHHSIPRQDYNNYSGDGSKGSDGGSGRK